mgnify:CR=1 FL=1|tara:strand:+ start:487 stop:744 length:258 start_codon:yes stop_codon:yes gene_type:complete
MAKLTRDSLVERASTIWTKMLDDVLKAGVKREWNKFVGSVPSKNDVVRAAQADLRVLNDVAKAYGWDSVYIDEEEEPVKLGKIKK